MLKKKVSDDVSWEVKAVSSNSQAEDELRELLLSPQLDIVRALFLATDREHNDQVTVTIFRFFQVNKREMMLLKNSIAQEIALTNSPSTLFRLNNLASKLMTTFNKLCGMEFLKASLGPIIDLICKDKANTISVEINPAKLKPGEDRNKNLQNLNKTCEDILLNLIKHVDLLPLETRQTSRYLRTCSKRRFPNDNTIFAAIGGFIFLRFVCPAIVCPHRFGVVDYEPTPQGQRVLLIVSKVMQTLASGARFGSKEQYMMDMNKFIDENSTRMSGFLNHVADVADPEENNSFLNNIAQCEEIEKDQDEENKEKGNKEQTPTTPKSPKGNSDNNLSGNDSSSGGSTAANAITAECDADLQEVLGMVNAGARQLIAKDVDWMRNLTQFLVLYWGGVKMVLMAGERRTQEIYIHLSVLLTKMGRVAPESLVDLLEQAQNAKTDSQKKREDKIKKEKLSNIKGKDSERKVMDRNSFAAVRKRSASVGGGLNIIRDARTVEISTPHSDTAVPTATAITSGVSPRGSNASPSGLASPQATSSPIQAVKKEGGLKRLSAKLFGSGSGSSSSVSSPTSPNSGK